MGSDHRERRGASPCNGRGPCPLSPEMLVLLNQAVEESEQPDGGDLNDGGPLEE
jgi:hypothetical protein